MRSSDKLIRQPCPSCHAEITLGRSSLNKKIKCPKCRQAVIIPDEVPAFVEYVPEQTAAARTSAFPLPQQTALVVEPLPLPQNRYSPEEIPAGQQQDGEKEPIVYCLCNGVLKRRIISKEWGPARSICCMIHDQVIPNESV
ncbi:MAG: hypothetical protein WCD79_00790 [Chthoniobacteraceae bacterium]